jgi:S-adenosylmethionine uptake transporter
VRAPAQAAWAVGAALAFAAMSAAIKFGFAHYGLFELVFWRNALGAVAIAVWALTTRRSVTTPHWRMHLRRSAAGTSSMVLWFVALAYLPLPTAATLGNVTPLFTAVAIALVAWRRGAPRDGRRGRLYAAAACGFAGVVLALRPTMDGADFAGVAAALLSGLFATFVFFEMRTLGRVGEPPWRVVFWFSAVASTVGLVGAAGSGGFSSHTLAGIGCLVAMAGFALLGQLCLTRAFSGPATLLAANLQYSNIGFAAVIGVLVFGDSLTTRELLGIAVIAASGAYATWVSARLSARLSARPATGPAADAAAVPSVLPLGNAAGAASRPPRSRPRP